MKTKRCTKCSIKYPNTKEFFYAKEKSKVGLRTYCKSCFKDMVNNKKREDDYGVSPEEYDVMFISQGGCCNICATHQDDQTSSMAVDHCHETMNVRGLLCIKCNVAIGLLKDDPLVVLEAAKYLVEN